MLLIMMLSFSCSDNKEKFIAFVSDPVNELFQEGALRTGQIFQVKLKTNEEIALKELLNNVITQQEFNNRLQELKESIHYEFNFPFKDKKERNELKEFISNHLESLIVHQEGDTENVPALYHIESDVIGGNLKVHVIFPSNQKIKNKVLKIDSGSFIQAREFSFDLTHLPQLTIN